MEQLVFLGIAILYGIGVSIYRFVKWANRQISGSAAPTPGQQALADAQRQAQGPNPQAPLAQTLPERPSAKPMPRQPQAGGPAVSSEATEEDFRRREQELQAESERAYDYFRRRAEALRAERGSAGSSAPLTAPTERPQPLTTPLPATAALARFFQTKDDVVRAVILREALGPPLSRRSPPQ